MKTIVISLLSIMLLALGILSSFVSEKELVNGPRLTPSPSRTPRIWLPYIVQPNAPTPTFTSTRIPTAISTSTGTASPTATNTSTQTPTTTSTATGTHRTGVTLEVIVYDPPSSDAGGEYVELRNNEFMSIDITGWTLRDEAGTVFTFPAFNLAGQATVRVWVRSGVNDGSNLYWGHNSAIWNNDGDVAFLRDANGVVKDVCGYSGGEEFAVCTGGIW